MRKEKGQTLVEAVFVIAIVGLALSGLVAAVIYFARVTLVAKYRSWATNLAQEKLEEIRSVSKEDPEAFWANIEKNYTGEELLSPPNYPGEFTRTTEVDLQQASSPRKAKITVTVSWQDGSETRSVTVSSYLTEQR